MNNCKNCNQELDALHMGDVDPELCIICENKIINNLRNGLEETTLVLWERNM